MINPFEVEKTGLWFTLLVFFTVLSCLDNRVMFGVLSSGLANFSPALSAKIIFCQYEML